MIANASRALSKPEKNYSAYRLEFLALKWAITEKFSYYLTGNHFMVLTNSNPLTDILTSAKLDATGQRWASALGEYDFDIFYRAGLRNSDVDGMSRYPHDRVIAEDKETSRTIKLLKPFAATLQSHIMKHNQLTPSILWGQQSSQEHS